MSRLVWIVVLMLTLTGVPRGRVVGWDAASRRDATHETTSPGAGGWHDRAGDSSIPILEAVPAAASGIQSASEHGARRTSAANPRHYAWNVQIHVTRPHDPPHLHTFTLLI